MVCSWSPGTFTGCTVFEFWIHLIFFSYSVGFYGLLCILGKPCLHRLLSNHSLRTSFGLSLHLLGWCRFRSWFVSRLSILVWSSVPGGFVWCRIHLFSRWRSLVGCRCIVVLWMHLQGLLYISVIRRWCSFHLGGLCVSVSILFLSFLSVLFESWC